MRRGGDETRDKVVGKTKGLDIAAKEKGPYYYMHDA